MVVVVVVVMLLLLLWIRRVLSGFKNAIEILLLLPYFFHFISFDTRCLIIYLFIFMILFLFFSRKFLFYDFCLLFR